jgi:hypothetical protein
MRPQKCVNASGYFDVLDGPGAPLAQGILYVPPIHKAKRLVSLRGFFHAIFEQFGKVSGASLCLRGDLIGFFQSNSLGSDPFLSAPTF